jgi:hypothetical protein
MAMILVTSFALAGCAGVAPERLTPEQQRASEMFDAGFKFASQSAGKNKDPQSSYNTCNILANGVYMANAAAYTLTDMDNWVQGCLDYIRN